MVGVTCFSAMQPVLEGQQFDVVILDECSQVGVGGVLWAVVGCCGVGVWVWVGVGVGGCRWMCVWWGWGVGVVGVGAVGGWGGRVCVRVWVQASRGGVSPGLPWGLRPGLEDAAPAPALAAASLLP